MAKVKTFVNAKGQTVAMDPFGSWKVYNPETKKFGAYAKGPDTLVSESAPAGVDPVESAHAIPPAPKEPDDDDMKNLRELANQILARVSAEGQKTDFWQEKLAKHAEVVERMLNDLGEQVKVAVDEIRDRDNLLKELAEKTKMASSLLPPLPKLLNPAAAEQSPIPLPPPPRPVPTGAAAPLEAVGSIEPRRSLMNWLRGLLSFRRQIYVTLGLVGIAVGVVVLVNNIPNIISLMRSSQIAQHSDETTVPPAAVPADLARKENLAALGKQIDEVKSQADANAAALKSLKAKQEAPQAQSTPVLAPGLKREVEKQPAPAVQKPEGQSCKIPYVMTRWGCGFIVQTH